MAKRHSADEALKELTRLVQTGHVIDKVWDAFTVRLTVDGQQCTASVVHDDYAHFSATALDMTAALNDLLERCAAVAEASAKNEKAKLEKEVAFLDGVIASVKELHS